MLYYDNNLLIDCDCPCVCHSASASEIWGANGGSAPVLSCITTPQWVEGDGGIS